jgi:hypothetical protein
MMDIKLITKADLDENNFYKEDALVFEGHIEIEVELGYVRFRKNISAEGYIFAKAGTGIKAGWDIEAGRGIKAGWGIEAGRGIKAGWDIEAGRGIKAGEGIEAGEGYRIVHKTCMLEG